MDRFIDKEGRAVGWMALAVALIGATYLATSAWERVRTHRQLTLQVTGSAKRRIVSDLIEWNAQIQTQDMDRIAAYRTLHEHVQKTLAYLKAQGLKEEEIRPFSITTEELHETEIVGHGEERIERRIFKGYRARQVISVRSTDVPRVERISREVTSLLEQGVPVTSYPAQYFYTKLGDLKIEMLAEASKDSRTRADNIVKSAGGAEIGRLVRASMGVININPANSTETSWEGNNDTTSLEKDIITIVHVTFELK
jgi:hypothetical protein